MEPKTTKKPSRKLVVFKRELPFYLMLIPGVTFLIIFSYLPMFGLVMAFQDFTPLRSFKNSPWVGLKNFRDMLALPTFWNVVGNTLSISIAKIILRLLVPLILALLLNEVIHHKFMRMAQTVFFLPYFLSWAVMGGVLRNLFQYDGMVNELLGRIGIDPIMFLGSNTWFPIIIILSDVWKDMGYLSGVRCARKVIPTMQARGGGSIINISSIHSLMSQPTNMLYAGTKGAMNAAARVMALDYAKDNIRVNTICPGVVISDVMYDDMDKLDDAGKKQLDDALHRCQPLEPGRMQDIANTALFFASNMSANITGQTLLSDGGTSIKAHDMDC